MGLFDWMNSRAVRSMSDEQGGGGWPRLGIYLYRADGRYGPAKWAETRQEFARMIPAIRDHVDRKLEVRITNTDDHLLFHATQKGIEWDDIRLGPWLANHPKIERPLKGQKRQFRKDGPDR